MARVMNEMWDFLLTTYNPGSSLWSYQVVPGCISSQEREVGMYSKSNNLVERMTWEE